MATPPVVGAFPWTTTTATTGTSTTTSSSTTKKDSNAVDSDMFLKLLVAQLKYQDPNNTTDPSQFLSQSAAFSTVEKLTSLEKLSTSLEKLTQQTFDSSRQQTAASLIGQTVTYADTATTTKTGVVTGVGLGTSTPTLTVGGVAVALDQITTVGTAATPTDKTKTSS